LSLGLLAGPTPAPMMRTLCPTRSAVRPTSRRSLEERRGRDEEEEPALGSEAISLYLRACVKNRDRALVTRCAGQRVGDCGPRGPEEWRRGACAHVW
jgi:hypothetical protein